MEFFRPILQLAQNVIAGTRAALFMPVYLWSFKSGYLQILLLLIISLSLSFLHDFFNTRPDNYFNPYGISYQAMLYLLFFFSLSLIAYLNSRLQDLMKLIVLFLSVTPIVWLGTMCLVFIFGQQSLIEPPYSGWFVFGLYLSWYLLITFRLIKRFFYLPILKTSLHVFLYAVINILPWYLLPSIPLWYSLPTVNEEVTGKPPVNIEKVYYAQDELVNRVMTDVLTERKDITDLYFVGFAGDAEEDVFMNEVFAARGILANRFNAHGRSVLLINNEETIYRYPLANKHNLEKVLEKIANHMNKEDDVLFLFLTSHGTEQHMLSANFSKFRLNDINADSIDAALNDAGIKWRIIVISACYSGGLIESLANPHTLLITAASADRPSFGCGHDGKYTYFGEAFFEQSLNETYSFVDAFEQAKKIISKRENEEGFKNSNPQISLGKEMKNKLIRLEKELEARAHSNWAYTIKE